MTGPEGTRTIRVNGVERPMLVTRVDELLSELGCSPERRGVAVALNGTVVPRSEWDSRPLKAGDEIEIVGAVQGG